MPGKMTAMQSDTAFFDADEKAFIDRFLEKGYAIVPLQERQPLPVTFIPARAAQGPHDVPKGVLRMGIVLPQHKRTSKSTSTTSMFLSFTKAKLLCGYDWELLAPNQGSQSAISIISYGSLRDLLN